MNIPRYIDIHAHLNFAAFDVDREEVVRRTLEAGTWVINVGTQQDTSRAAVELAQKHDGFFAAVGLHPIHTSRSYHDTQELGEGGKEFTSRGEIFDTTIYRKIAAHPKVVAIGECGLDYYRENTDSRFKVQEEMFRQQIELALEVRKPLMLHLRNGSGKSAYKDAFSILSTYNFKPITNPGNLHFFAGTIEEAKLFLDLGFTFSFTGVITFTRDYDEVISYLPLDRIMSETDSPYVAPVPYRGKRNEPSYVHVVVERIAHIKKLEVEAVRKQLLLNAAKLFSVPLSR